MSSSDSASAPPPADPVGTCTATDGSTSQTTESACTGLWTAPTGGRRHRGIKTKTLRRMLKKAGLKVSGKKATLRARAKKAHLVRGGAEGLGVVGAAEQAAPATGGRRTRRHRRSRKFF